MPMRCAVGQNALVGMNLGKDEGCLRPSDSPPFLTLTLSKFRFNQEGLIVVGGDLDEAPFLRGQPVLACRLMMMVACCSVPRHCYCRGWMCWRCAGDDDQGTPFLRHLPVQDDEVLRLLTPLSFVYFFPAFWLPQHQSWS